MMYRLRTKMFVLWTRVPQPRAISVITGIGYFAAAFTGALTIIVPPHPITEVADTLLLGMVGWFMFVGGIVGMLAGAFDFWQLERAAIGLMGWGLITYLYFVLVLTLEGELNKITQLGIIAMALSFLAVRLAMIWRYPFKPRGSRDADQLF